MTRPKGVRRYLVLLSVALVAVLAVPAGADAARYRFKVVDFKLDQYVRWHTIFRDIDCESRSSADYYEHTGSGQAALVSDDFLRRGRVTFKTAQGTFLPARIDGRPFEDRPDLRGAFAYRAAEADWSVTYKDDPESDCVPREALGRPDSSCAKEQDPNFDPDTWPSGMLLMNLLFDRGRLRLSGGYYPFDNSRTCGDPSVVSGTVSHAVPNKRGLGQLIRDEDVRRIRLRASKDGFIPGNQLATPGASFESLGGEGADYTAEWSMTLVRR